MRNLDKNLKQKKMNYSKRGKLLATRQWQPTAKFQGFAAKQLAGFDKRENKPKNKGRDIGAKYPGVSVGF